MDTPEAPKSIWSKTSNDLTVADNMKIQAAALAVPLGLIAVVVTVGEIKKKLQLRKLAKETKKTEKE